MAVCQAIVVPAPAYGGYPGVGAYHAGVAAYPAVAKVAAVSDYDPNPQYSYSYDIHVR